MYEVPPQGLEQSTDSQGNTPVSELRPLPRPLLDSFGSKLQELDQKSDGLGAFSPKLQSVIDAWPVLPIHVQETILLLIHSVSSRVPELEPQGGQPSVLSERRLLA